MYVEAVQGQSVSGGRLSVWTQSGDLITELIIPGERQDTFSLIHNGRSQRRSVQGFTAGVRGRGQTSIMWLHNNVYDRLGPLLSVPRPATSDHVTETSSSYERPHLEQRKPAPGFAPGRNNAEWNPAWEPHMKIWKAFSSLADFLIMFYLPAHVTHLFPQVCRITSVTCSALRNTLPTSVREATIRFLQLAMKDD